MYSIIELQASGKGLGGDRGETNCIFIDPCILNEGKGGESRRDFFSWKNFNVCNIDEQR